MTTVTIGTAGKGEKELRTSWPVTSGLTAGTTKQKGRQARLVPELASTVPKRNKEGFY